MRSSILAVAGLLISAPALAGQGSARIPLPDGFMPEGVTLGNDGKRLWRGMVLQVFAYDWSSVSFEES